MTVHVMKRYVGLLLAMAVLVVVLVTGLAAHSSSSAPTVSQAAGAGGDMPSGAASSAGSASLTEASGSSATQPGVGIYRGTLPVAHYDVSPPLRDIKPIEAQPGQKRENEEIENMGGKMNESAPREDTSVQKL